jgi:protein-tyrosine phosphatase
MTLILVVCTGNICRSPIAEGLLRGALVSRFGDLAPEVSSAGTSGVSGSGATPEAVAAAAERGADIETHVARRFSRELADAADLVVVMSTEHREVLAEMVPELRERTFTLKELVRVLESLPPAQPAGTPDGLSERVTMASRARQDGFSGNPLDDDVADPLGLPLQSYRAIAWELDGWIERLVDGLFGAQPASAASEG